MTRLIWCVSEIRRHVLPDDTSPVFSHVSATQLKHPKAKSLLEGSDHCRWTERQRHIEPERVTRRHDVSRNRMGCWIEVNEPHDGGHPLVQAYPVLLASKFSVTLRKTNMSSYIRSIYVVFCGPRSVLHLAQSSTSSVGAIIAY